MDYQIVLQLFPILMGLLIFFILLEMKNSSFQIAGTRDWALSYVFLFLYAVIEIFITDRYYLFGSLISSIFFITAFIYIEYSIRDYNNLKHNFLLSIFSGSVILVYGILNLFLRFDNGEIFNILYSIVMIVILTETILFIRQTRDFNSKLNYYKPLCPTLALLITFFLIRILTNFDFGIHHTDELSLFHTYLYILHLALLISVSLSMSYIYKWFYISELKIASELQKSAIEKITILSETDDLTQISNRRHIENIIKNKILQFNRLDNDEKLSIAVIDINRFKYINDTLGHHMGDEILIKFSNIFSNNLRQNDVIGRWGGDEFLIMLPNTNIIDATNLMEKFLKLITDTDFGIDFQLTFSYGVKEYDPSLDYNEFFKVVDHLLYSSKRRKDDIIKK